MMESNGVDVADEHYYMAPEWFIDNRTRFDSFKRGSTKIFVGEYASRGSSGQEGEGNKLFNAVAEAVYLTGVERNSDLVLMTAYAPLLARYNHRQWPAANLIWFDHNHLVRTPNYFVQQMFSTHLGDHYVPSALRFKDERPVDGKAPVLGISATRDSREGTVFIKLANPMSVPVEAEIELDGLEASPGRAEALELVGDKDARNDLTEPDRLRPVQFRFDASRKFTRMLKPCSVQVLTLNCGGNK
jgi:alpha-L-arabinofuranosidase